MRPLAVLAAAALLVATGAAAAQPRCPTSAEGLARPSEAHPAHWTYSEGPDRIVVSTAPSWVNHHALGGDDTIFVMAPPAGISVSAGRGADVIVVCSLRESSLVLSMVEFEETSFGDGAADLVVIEPEAFLGVPPGVTVQISVFGFTAGQDRIRLRLPPGITPQFAPNFFTTLRAGPIAILVGPVDNPMPVGPEGLEFEQAQPAYQPVWPVPAPAFTGYDPGLTCAAAPPAAAVPQRLAPGNHTFKAFPVQMHGPAAAPMRLEAGADTMISLSDADDRALVFDGGVLSAGAGADQIVVCRFAGEHLSIAAGPGSAGALDLDADTIVVEAARMQDAPRTLGIVNLNPLNDRIVLRLPPGLEPEFRLEGLTLPSDPGAHMPQVQVGMLRITMLTQVWERVFDVHVDPAMFAVDRLPAP